MSPSPERNRHRGVVLSLHHAAAIRRYLLPVMERLESPVPAAPAAQEPAP
jgi:hypothetical protein